ncbi:hypothetical protein [Caproicibacter fermentans]|nr:hypothetical protein [Caproicibacter fermentans]
MYYSPMKGGNTNALALWLGLVQSLALLVLVLRTHSINGLFAMMLA